VISTTLKRIGEKRITRRAFASVFDRESALSQYKEQCQLNLVLAMGLATQKESGMSQVELKKIAAKSKSPEIMEPMVIQLFAKPVLQGRTFTFFNFESCLVSKATKSPVVSLSEIRAPIKLCEKHSDMRAFVKCIDKTITEHRTQS
jgi:hypothetical protein